MKYKLMACVLAGTLLFSACGGKSGIGAGDRQKAVLSDSVKTAAAGSTQAGPDYNAVYDPVLKGFYDFISGRSSGDTLKEGVVGIREGVLGLSPAEALDAVGYAIQDISGDGIPELLIGRIRPRDSGVGPGNDIYAVYTCRDGRPVGSFEGWTRNNYQYMGKGRFFHQGSGGAMYSIFGTYAMVKDGTSLSCTDCYFTWEKDPGMTELAFYHNRSGEVDKKVSEEMDITREKFWKLCDDFARKTQKIALSPFSRYKKPTAPGASAVSGPQVRVEWAKDGLAAYSSYESFIASRTEPTVKVLFTSPAGVRDFRVLALTPVEQNGKITFSVEERYLLKNLTPERPLVVTMTFYGDIPNNGISYIDGIGRTKRFAVGMSGEDGSLMLKEF